MREYFASPNEDHRLQDEWANFKQYEIIFEYMLVLTALTMRIPGLSQTQILDKFIHELISKTRIEVELRDRKTPNETYRLTDRFDRIDYGAKNISFLTQNYNHYAPTTNADYDESMQIDTLRPHRSESKNSQRPRNQGLCFTCGKSGHIAANCPIEIRQFRKRNQ